MSLNCPACATENREGAKCCKDCGAPLVQHCPDCAAPCKLGAKFWPCNAFSIDLGNTVTKQDLTEVDNTEITGPDETAAMAAIKALIADRFGEGK